MSSKKESRSIQAFSVNQPKEGVALLKKKPPPMLFSDKLRHRSPSETDHTALSPPRPFFFEADSDPFASSDQSIPDTRRGQRNHQRSSSTDKEPWPDTEHVLLTADTPSISRESSYSVSSDPFGTPSNPFSGGLPAGDAFPPIGSARSPRSFFPFPNHSPSGDPDPDIPMHDMGRRASMEASRARGGPHQRSSSTPNYLGIAYPTGSDTLGYGLLEHGATSHDDLTNLGRPYAPFMRDGMPSPRLDGSATPPSPMSGQHRLYMNSAAAAITGSQYALHGYGMSMTSTLGLGVLME